MNAISEKLRTVWPHRFNDYLLVTLITVLIWVYAEGRNVQTYQPSDRVPVTIQLGADDLVVIGQSVDSIEVEFSAATAEIDELRQLLGKQGIVLRPQINEAGAFPLVLDNEIWQADPVNQVSVNVNWTDPQTVDVLVDRLVSRKVPVRFDPGDVKLVEDSLTIDPPVVTLTAPEQMLAQLGINDGFTLEAEPLVPVRSLTPGEERKVDARVKLPASLASSEHVTLDGANVKLTLTIDKAEESIVLPNVPVWIAAPPGSLADFTVKLSEDTRVLADVKVSGPPDLIERVRDGREKVIAILRLTSDRLAAAVGETNPSGTVTIEAPPPLVVEDPERTVQFTVTRKPNPGTSTSP